MRLQDDVASLLSNMWTIDDRLRTRFGEFKILSKGQKQNSVRSKANGGN